MGKFCVLGVVAVVSPVCGLCMPGADTPIAFIASDADQRFTGGEPSSPISLRAVSPNGSAPFAYDWLAIGPAGCSANELLASGEGSTTQGSTTQGSATQFSAAAERGLYELFSTITDSTGSVHVGRKLLRVGSVSGLDTSATHLGVVAGDPRVGGTDGQTLVQVNPRFGIAPYEVTWTTRSPDGGVDNGRLLAVNSLASTFTSTDKTGTYIVTAEIVDSVGAAAVESVAVIVRDGPALEVSADRVSVLPRGGADGMVGLLATPIGGSEPFTYEWEIIGPDGARHNDLLWDTSVRDPIFESDSSGAATGVPASTRGVFVARCAASGAFGTVLIGSTTIDVTDGISLAIYADRLTLPAAEAGSAQATLTATVRGAREPLSIVWRVSGPDGKDAASRLTNSTGAETRFAPDLPGAESGSYVVRCSVSDARGSADDKGQAMCHLMAIEAWLKVAKKLPCRVKVLIEGEEEIGSPNLEKLTVDNLERLACDIVVISDTSKFSSEIPALTCGTKGLVYKDIRITGPKQNLHSGCFGGTVANPGNVLAELIAAMKDANNKITFPGFYDDVVAVTGKELEDMKALPFDDAQYLKDLGSPALDGEHGYSTIERKGVRPTLDVNGMYGGYMEEGAMTIIPRMCGAKVSMRVVPNQDPEKISKMFDDFVRANCPDTVKLEIDTHGVAAPYATPLDLPAVKAASAAIERGFGKKPVFIREGGTIPIMALFKKLLKAESVLMGFSDPNCNLHGPNEFFHVSDYLAGIRSSACFFSELARGV